MILDERAEFCDATAINTGAAGTYLVGDVMDLDVARDVGAGKTMWVVIQVTTAFTSGGSATVRWQLASDSVAAIAADGTESIHADTGFLTAVASCVAGFQWAIAIPPEMSEAFERFLGIQQVTGTAAFTAGAINAFLTIDPPARWNPLADGNN